MSVHVVSQIRALAAERDSEICGALIGNESAILEAWPLPNHSSDGRRSYFIPATTVLRTERQAEQRGLQLVGFYHSHPRGNATPSQSDTTHALPGYLYLIVARNGDARVWRLRDDRTGFDEVAD